jgi:hypothetical protein
MSDDERRELLSLAFEPSADGYVYYRNRWSGGVPVTNHEREAFLSSDIGGMYRLSREFSKRRPITPPRHFNPWLIADALPKTLGPSLIGMAVVASGIAISTTGRVLSSAMWLCTGFLAICGIALLLRRQFRHD